MKKRFMSYVFTLLIAAALLPQPAYANSSWHWISETRPYDVLPFAICVTLLVEILAAFFAARTEALAKTVVFVLLGNLLSFAAPYLLAAVNSPVYDFRQTLTQTPFYTVGAIYLVLTLAVEIPVVYAGLKETVQSKRRLLITLAAANVVTTGVTAIVERTLCTGSW